MQAGGEEKIVFQTKESKMKFDFSKEKESWKSIQYTILNDLFSRWF